MNQTCPATVARARQRTLRAAVVVAVLFASSSAYAQQPIVSLSPPNPARWDIAGHIGWLTVNKSEIAPEWNEWYDAAAGGVSAGYYLTPHVKLEAELSTATTGSIFIEEPIVALPGNVFPYYRARDHMFRQTTVGAGAAYQFFDNRWFHPFLSGGVAVTHETRRADFTQPYFSPGPTPIPIPALPPLRQESTFAHPYLAAGFKAYMTERVFMRGEVRTTFSDDHAEAMVWRAGFGFDF